ncbi:TPA: hypothetical protein AB5E57_001619 [Vibrio cholerae]|uniref:hypothetical protein n=1 Tax=Vibrio cholerae TaxID=666 RepID=UPI001C92E940|nr:hypothetical protein [Vibrio cholerae]MBY4642206.1 hypothetical protein [Vibrio cholerae]MCR9658478.1 hypothetical protein [Vibrio cholerae]MCR9689160.1 hypothetical protein [Vibrio cholerae]MCR9746491.1 hypothetical protein [Vibrio cholerae]
MKVTYLPFNKDMIIGLLDGRKTATRRVIKIPEGWELHDSKISKITSSHPKKGKWGALIRKGLNTSFPQSDLVSAPCAAGDLVWVRETWGVISHEFDENGNIKKWNPDRPSTQVKELKLGKGYYTGHVIYRADGEMRWCNDFEDEISAWHPSIHMPREASRLTLKITDVRIERVQDITEADAIKEGVHPASPSSLIWPYRTTFMELWDDLYKSWCDNPYVWVIEFEVIHQNVDVYIKNMNKAA